MQHTIVINHDTRGPLRVRFSAFGSVWIREFHDLGEADAFARSSRLNGKRTRVEVRS